MTLTLAVELVTIAVGGAILIVGIALGALITIIRPLRYIAVSTRDITLRVLTNTPFVAALVYKPWFSSSFKLIHGEIKFFVGSRTLVTITPDRVDTTPPGRIADVLVQAGELTGTGTMSVDGTSRKGSHATERITVTVTR